MEKKAFIKSCRRNGYKYIHIACLLKVSRQRVEQILHRDKSRARKLVYHSNLVKLPCSYLGCQELKVEAHHSDYSKPLEVVWLCSKHHKLVHRKPRTLKVKKPRLCLGCRIEIAPRTFRCNYCWQKHRRQYFKSLYHNNPTRREMIYRANSKWRIENPDKHRAISRRASLKYYYKNKDTLKNGG